MDVWLTQVAGLARANNNPLRLTYGAGEIYGDDFEGVEEGWEPRAMDYFGFTTEVLYGTEVLSTNRNLFRIEVLSTNQSLFHTKLHIVPLV